MTPYKKDEWQQYYPNFLEKIMLKKDFDFLMSASGYMMQFIRDLPDNQRKNFKINIYCRMFGQSGNLRWVFFHAPLIMLDENGTGYCSLVFVSDLGFFDMRNEPRMSILDFSDFRHPKTVLELDDGLLQNTSLPKLSRREKEIVACILQGMKTPEIAEKLFISYHIVENHKKNLRTKTHTNTSGELISFILNNQLL